MAGFPPEGRPAERTGKVPPARSGRAEIRPDPSARTAADADNVLFKGAVGNGQN